MKNYNYYSSLDEVLSFFQIPFNGQGFFCDTKLQEPYLVEIPIEIKITQSLDSDKSNLCIVSIQKLSDQPKKKETILLLPENTSCSEDLLQYKDSENEMSIQALNSDEIHLVWEKIFSGKRKIFFSGKLKSTSQFFHFGDFVKKYFRK
jgi:hypothetical protein